MLHKNQTVKGKATVKVTGNELHPQILVQGEEEDAISVASFPLDEYEIHGEDPPEVELNLKYLGIANYNMNQKSKGK